MHSGSGSIYCAKFCLDLEPEPKLFQNRNRNRDKSLRFHNTVHNKASQNLKTIGSKSTYWSDFKILQKIFSSRDKIPLKPEKLHNSHLLFFEEISLNSSLSHKKSF